MYKLKLVSGAGQTCHVLLSVDILIHLGFGYELQLDGTLTRMFWIL